MYQWEGLTERWSHRGLGRGGFAKQMALGGGSICSYVDGDPSGLGMIFYSSCTNHYIVITINLFLVVAFLLNLFQRVLTRGIGVHPLFRFPSLLHTSSLLFNGCLGLVYLGLGLWMLEENLRGNGYFPWHLWGMVLSQGFTSILTGLIVSVRERQMGKVFFRVWSATWCMFTVLLCISSSLDFFTGKKITVKLFLDILSLPGAIMLLLCTLKASEEVNYSPYMLLKGQLNANETDTDDCVTSFSTAGFLSRMTFWWLNPLMKKGYGKLLEEKDIPQLGEVDRVESSYALFLEKLHCGGWTKRNPPPSILWTILACYRNEILVSGFFALLKTITLSAGPAFLSAFIKVLAGKESFKHEIYVLAFGMFLAKCLESLSQRQWYFRSRMLGLKVRSLLTASIYQKQLRLANSAKLIHSSGEIVNYVTVDAYRIGEFPIWIHQIWATSLQLCIVLAVLYNAIGLATVSAMAMIILIVLCNSPLAKLQNKFQAMLMKAQDERLKGMSEVFVNMKALKLYAWEAHFERVIEGLRAVEVKWLSAFQFRKSYNAFFFWSLPVLVSAATFFTCYLLDIPLNSSNVFTFIASFRLVQDPVRLIPDIIGAVIQAKVAFGRIGKFLEAPELQNGECRRYYVSDPEHPIVIKSATFSWDEALPKPTLTNINLVVKYGRKVAVCGEVGSGKSTLLAAILGEIPNIEGTVQICGKIAYVSQTAWIQTGTVQENILFGSSMDKQRYHETLEKCSLVKDLDMLPFGDLTEIGERGVNLSGGQKQRIQLARALYQDSDIYLLDDPFSSVDPHTAASLFNEYVMGALLGKTVLLVTHQVDFLPSFDSILFISNGKVLCSAPFHELFVSSKDFQGLVNAHDNSLGPDRFGRVVSSRSETSMREIINTNSGREVKTSEISGVDQLIKKEERETGNAGVKPYMEYVSQSKGFFYVLLAALSQVAFTSGQILQNSWMAANVENPRVSTLRLITVYLTIGIGALIFLISRSVLLVAIGIKASRSLFSQLLSSLFRAPMVFFDSTPSGRILSRFSSDMSIVDLDLPFSLCFSMFATLSVLGNLGVLAVVTWQVLFVSIPMIFLTIRLQRYYLATAKELMRINGTTKSFIANHLAESMAGAITIRAFKEEDRFFAKCLELINKNDSPFLHNFAATEWLIQRLETMSAAVLASSALVMALLPPGTFSSGFAGMALSYGLSLNNSLVSTIQSQCMLAKHIVSAERLNQYMHIRSEAPQVIEGNRPPFNWPSLGRVELHDLQVRYRLDSPLVLRGISCTFEGGHKIGIVGRTGSGKTTLIAALFRLVEPTGGRIIIDGLDITSIGLHDLRSRLGIIPQDATLFPGSVRYNLDPLGQHTDQHIWQVLEKCQLEEAVKEKGQGLDSLVTEDGSNWSMGQRQLFCLGRAMLRRSRIIVLDEATASMDNATDAVLQKSIRVEFADCTVITVAHRIHSVMDCTMVLSIGDGKLVEYDEPAKLLETEGSLFGELAKEYWSHNATANIQSTGE